MISKSSFQTPFWVIFLLYKILSLFIWKFICFFRFFTTLIEQWVVRFLNVVEFNEKSLHKTTCCIPFNFLSIIFIGNKSTLQLYVSCLTMLIKFCCFKNFFLKKKQCMEWFLWLIIASRFNFKDFNCPTFKAKIFRIKKGVRWTISYWKLLKNFQLKRNKLALYQF